MIKENHYIIIPIKNKNIFQRHNGIAELILIRLVHKNINLKEIDLYCYSLLPEGLHIVFSFSDSWNKPLNIWVSAFKRNIGRDVKKTFNEEINWGKGFHQEYIKNPGDFNAVLQKILEESEKPGHAESGHDSMFFRFIKNPPFPESGRKKKR